MKGRWLKTLLGIMIGFLAIQFIPVDRENPPVETEILTSTEVRVILTRACYDCHSNETVWPWYSRLAPVSWLLAWDVHEGREELNFSTWNRYDWKKRQKIMKELWEEVKEGEMPPWFYLPLHPEARLSDSDYAVIRTWAGTSRSLSYEEQD